MLKELNLTEMQKVTGGYQVTLMSPAGAAIRTIPGFGAVVSSAKVGWKIGEWLNKNTRIQALIADLIG